MLAKTGEQIDLAIQAAKERHGPWPSHDLQRCMGLLQEEIGEAQKEVNNATRESSGPAVRMIAHCHMRFELTQAAASLLEWLDKLNEEEDASGT